MGAQFSSLQTEVELQINRDDLTTYVKAAINDAIIDIALMAEPHELADIQTITTSSGTTGYTLDTDCLAIQHVVVTNVDDSEKPRTLFRRGPREWLERSRDSDAYGVPSYWHRRGNTVHFFDQTPDDNGGDNYTIEVAYIKRPATLTDNSDTSDLDEEYDETVIMLASAKMMRRTQDFEKADALNSEVLQQLQLRKSDRNYEDQYDTDAHAEFI